MAIVIAILLALILVAIMSSNEAASNNVWRVIRILILVSMIGSAWLILVGYSLLSYEAYSDKSDWQWIGVAVAAILPLFAIWINWRYIVEMFQTGNKRLFKQLGYILLGVIAYVVVGIGYQELSKAIPNIGWTILICVFSASFIILILQGFEKGWKSAFSFPKDPFEASHEQYDIWYKKEVKDWEDGQTLRQGLTESELEDAQDKYEDRLNDLWRKREALEEQLSKSKKKENYILTAFYYSLAFMVIGSMPTVWNWLIDWVMTFEYVKGRMWMAIATVVGVPLGIIGFISGINEDRNKEKEMQK